jgi:cell division protease FtsH
LYLIGYVLAVLVLLYLVQMFAASGTSQTWSYTQFKSELAAGHVATVVIGPSRLTGATKATSTTKVIDFTTNIPSGTSGSSTGSDPSLYGELTSHGVDVSYAGSSISLGLILSYLLPIVFIGVIWYWIYRRSMSLAGGGARGGGIFGVGRSKAVQVKPEQVGVTFKDVGGADEAIDELREIIQFLKTPEQFASLGGRIPKGVLLVGPPGTGKTLLAKATAGEAEVTFFESSGSEFVEMFVGVGAARVRDLFEQARQAAPAIVFIDEIDAIGQSRGAQTYSGGNDEREQTLNQLLAEIDGFNTDKSRPVIIMAATNRPEVLDPALLRAGRFDRQVEVSNPDLIGRVQILKIHSRGVTLSKHFDLERAARITPGFSGADLANAINEAALLAARRKAASVEMKDFEAAMERVVAGLERKTRVMNEVERNTVAYHESGHALVSELLPTTDPVAKISIIPRGRGALGYTLQMPTEDRYLLTEEELNDRVSVMLGGRAAESLTFDSISTGASDDIQKATELVRRMVTEFGMSKKLGSVRYAGQQLQYLGHITQENSELSPHTRDLIDAEVQDMVTLQYERAKSLLQQHNTALGILATRLLEQETLDGSEVAGALKAEEEGQVAEPPSSPIP